MLRGFVVLGFVPLRGVLRRTEALVGLDGGAVAKELGAEEGAVAGYMAVRDTFVLEGERERNDREEGIVDFSALPLHVVLDLTVCHTPRSAGIPDASQSPGIASVRLELRN